MLINRTHSRHSQLVHSMVLMLVLLLSPKVSAQSLFDGVPEPSMENYAQIWEQITGLPYRPDSSTLLLGQELSQDNL